MKTTRREILLFAGGSAVGVLMTPAPWRLITDSALWSENWPGIPRPARGAITAKYTNCALCGAGCAVRARCVAEQPVSLAGVAGHPLSHGALCAYGLAGHHLPYHPARVTGGPVEEAAAAVAAAMDRLGENEHVAVLDLRPGRTASWTYRRAMAAVKNGVYVAADGAAAGLAATNAAIDLWKARTVLSLGVPLLEGWGTPGNVMAARAGFHLIQAEAVESRTAAMADQWLRIKAGSEEALGQGILQALGGQTPVAAAEATGIAEQQFLALASELKQNGPALVVGGARSQSAAQLNEALGALGHTIVARREAPVPDGWKKAAPVVDLASVEDGSIRVLLIDESAPGAYLPWSAVEPKLVRDNPLVVTLGWTREGYGRHAQYLLPTGVYPEVADDIPPAVDSVAAAFRMAVPLVQAPEGVVKPEEWIAKAAGLEMADTLRERADAIHKAGRGTLFTYADGKSVATKDVKIGDFWKALEAGGCWMDQAGPAQRPAAVKAAAGATRQSASLADDLPLVAVLTEAPSSPLLSKIYQESNLKLGPKQVAIHPDEARAAGVEDGARALLETLAGRIDVEVRVDASVPRGAVLVASRAAVLDVCGAGVGAKVVQA
ncbi:MAG: molybdopterin dinucleotide binding domain-containing protein [Bryobacteraceae bacterium]|jgi:anaerobic selenocysteine-containing dehydrogenase